MDLIDTHCHLNDRAFDDDRADVIDRAAQSHVRRMLVIGCDLAGIRSAIELATSTWSGAEVYAILGLHPESGSEWGEDARRVLTELHAKHSTRIVGYGEIGLDYHWETVPRERQRQIFAEQIAFSESLRSNPLPIVVHSREAMDDVLDVLKGAVTRSPVVIHCFTGTVEDARRCIDAGYFLGIGGVATYKKSEDVRAAVAFAPLDRLILETDCPYLAPQKWRGRRNEPSYVTAVAETVAQVRGMTVEDVAASTTANAVRLFGLE